MMIYPIAASGQRLIFTRPVLNHFTKHRQSRWWSREAGGQLFARLELPDIIVEDATGPRSCDWRTRFSYRPSRAAEQQEIRSRYVRGLHFVGDWHTHPEDIPRASHLDIASMQDTVSKSAHSLNGFVMVIVGTGNLLQALAVALCDGKSTFFLEPESPSRQSLPLTGTRPRDSEHSRQLTSPDYA